MTLVLVMKNYLLPTLEAGNAKSGPMQVATCQLDRQEGEEMEAGGGGWNWQLACSSHRGGGCVE